MHLTRTIIASLFIVLLSLDCSAEIKPYSALKGKDAKLICPPTPLPSGGKLVCSAVSLAPNNLKNVKIEINSDNGQMGVSSVFCQFNKVEWGGRICSVEFQQPDPPPSDVNYYYCAVGYSDTKSLPIRASMTTFREDGSILTTLDCR